MMEFIDGDQAQQLHGVISHEVPASLLSAYRVAVLLGPDAVSFALKDHKSSVVNVCVVTKCRHGVNWSNVTAHLPPPTVVEERRNNNRISPTWRTQTPSGG